MIQVNDLYVLQRTNVTFNNKVCSYVSVNLNQITVQDQMLVLSLLQVDIILGLI